MAGKRLWLKPHEYFPTPHLPASSRFTCRRKGGAALFQNRAGRIWRGRSVHRHPRAGLAQVGQGISGVAVVRGDGVAAFTHPRGTVAGVLILVDGYARADAAGRAKIYALYLENLDCVNNWDLVDSSTPYIVGPHLAERSRKILFRLVRAKSLWHRRVAMLATFHFIRQNDFADALRLAELLRDDEHDLMHKAVGWMLREIGKRDVSVLEKFLNAHAARMPRTMLRYAIEKLSERERQRYLRAGKA